jgi:hypothetical protein
LGAQRNPHPAARPLAADVTQGEDYTAAFLLDSKKGLGIPGVRVVGSNLLERVILYSQGSAADRYSFTISANRRRAKVQFPFHSCHFPISSALKLMTMENLKWKMKNRKPS